MPIINITITPPLTGVASKLYYMVNGNRYPVIDLPLSVDGTIEMSIGTSAPDIDYFVFFPEQTVDNITYLETDSVHFNLLKDVNIAVTLTPIAIPEPPIPLEEILILAPTLVGIAIVVLSLR